MNEKEIESAFDIADVCASVKRVVMLKFLSRNPMSYGEIVKNFEKVNVLMGSSEFYKHIRKEII